MANKSNKNSNQSSQKIPVPLASLPAVLLPWYDREKRSLPWRDIVTPYRTWVSEIMLQQTRVSAVLPYYYRFLEALPDIPALAACEEERLHKLWEGLGYYSRVRNLQKAAKLVCAQYGGQLPADYAALLDTLQAGLGDERAKQFHAHFSRIAYTKGGEKCHLTFADTAFGPPHLPLLQLLKARGLAPTIICESAGTQAEDAAALAQGYAAL